jgi:hypothetical protein
MRERLVTVSRELLTRQSISQRHKQSRHPTAQKNDRPARPNSYALTILLALPSVWMVVVDNGPNDVTNKVLEMTPR